MGPNLKELEAFVAVVEAGGFREAARAIGSSASGVSDAVRRLDATIHAAPDRARSNIGNPVERQLGLLKAAFEQDA